MAIVNTVNMGSKRPQYHHAWRSSPEQTVIVPPMSALLRHFIFHFNYHSLIHPISRLVSLLHLGMYVYLLHCSSPVMWTIVLIFSFGLHCKCIAHWQRLWLGGFKVDLRTCKCLTHLESSFVIELMWMCFCCSSSTSYLAVSYTFRTV